MSVNVTKNADGTITCWGKMDLLIPEGGPIVRSQNIGPFPEFAEEPTVCVSIYTRNDKDFSSPFAITGIESGVPNFTLFKITAQDVSASARENPSLSTWFCNFIVIGKPL